MPNLARASIVALLLVASMAACGGDDDRSADVEPLAPGASGYVALGDSIAAGGGAPPYDPASGRCSRSEEAFPILLDESLDDVQLTSFPACGGARVENVLTEPLHGSDAQLPSTPDPDVGLVTLTIGANDLGYGTFLVTCFVADCAIDNPDGAAGFERRLDDLRTQLTEELYPALLDAYPEARIVHVSYPRFVNALPTDRCDWLTRAEQELIDGSLVEIHRTIAEAVDELADPRVEYLDAIDAIEGHELCTEEPWAVAMDEEGGGHPDARGYEALAAFLAEAIG